MDKKDFDKRLSGLSEQEFFELIKYGLDIFGLIHEIRGDWKEKTEAINRT